MAYDNFSSEDQKRITQLEEIIKKQKDEINRLKKNTMELEKVSTERLMVIDSIYKSTSWKITTPFRKITACLKKYFNRHPKQKKLVKKVLSFFGIRKRQKIYKGIIVSFEYDKKKRAEEERRIFPNNISFSILVPLYNTPIEYLKDMIRSVTVQTYTNWELCLADGSDSNHSYVEQYCKQLETKDSRIHYRKLERNMGISENTNACIDMATGNYIALFDHDDLLLPNTLFEYAKAISEEDADFLYCDEDKFEKVGQRSFDPHFKPDFAPDNLRAINYICHFTVFKKELLVKIGGGFRKAFDGSQDHDLILRLTEKAEKIVHIPKILYHWRVSSASVASDPYAKPYTITAGIKAVSEHLERSGLKGTVESSTIHPNIYRIRYELREYPLISIIIPNNNHVAELSKCIQSILQKTTYENYEILIIENNSNRETFDYYETLKDNDRIRIIEYVPVYPSFNYSAINNYGVQFAKGDYYLLLNNDVEIISPAWIEEMLMFAQRPDVGAVGAKLYYPDNTIQHAGVILGIQGVAGHAFKHFSRSDAGYFGRAMLQQDLSAVTAACVMISKEVFEEIGGLDESFEVAFNDIDMCMRIRKKGYLIVFTPYAELYHYESISRGDDEKPEKRRRFISEVTRFQDRWKKELEQGDPYYNHNLSLDTESFDIAVNS